MELHYRALGFGMVGWSLEWWADGRRHTPGGWRWNGWRLEWRASGDRCISGDGGGQSGIFDGGATGVFLGLAFTHRWTGGFWVW